MGRSARVTEDRLVDEAIAIVEQNGLSALTINAVADALGVRAPSLYNHLTGIDQIRAQVRTTAIARLGQQLTDAVVGRSGTDALIAFCYAYRSFAAANPELYELTIASKAGRDENFDRHAWNAMRPLYTVLATHGLEDAAVIHAARTVRSALHGFVSLELAEGFGLPEQIDETFDRMVDWLLGLLDR